MDGLRTRARVGVDGQALRTAFRRRHPSVSPWGSHLHPLVTALALALMAWANDPVGPSTAPRPGLTTVSLLVPVSTSQTSGTTKLAFIGAHPLLRFS